MKLKELQKYNGELEIQLESHCGQINDCVGAVEKGNSLLLCNEEGYAWEEYLQYLNQSNSQSNNSSKSNSPS